MNVDKIVTAIFLQCDPPVKIIGDPTAYYSLQDAYNAAMDDDVIQSQTLVFTENLNINNPAINSITIEGGYDCTYSDIIGETKIAGNMNITDGTVTIENIQLQ
jgi:hypothetical protein